MDNVPPLFIDRVVFFDDQDDHRYSELSSYWHHSALKHENYLPLRVILAVPPEDDHIYCIVGTNVMRHNASVLSTRKFRANVIVRRATATDSANYANFIYTRQNIGQVKDGLLRSERTRIMVQEPSFHLQHPLLTEVLASLHRVCSVDLRPRAQMPVDVVTRAIYLGTLELLIIRMFSSVDPAAVNFALEIAASGQVRNVKFQFFDENDHETQKKALRAILQGWHRSTTHRGKLYMHSGEMLRSTLGNAAKDLNLTVHEGSLESSDGRVLTIVGIDREFWLAYSVKRSGINQGIKWNEVTRSVPPPV